MLGQEPGGERWIETLSRRGYRFVGPIAASTQKNGGLAPLERIVQEDTRPQPESGDIQTPRTGPERRQLSIMSCELVCGRLELEDMREAVRVYQRCVADVVGSFQGSVAEHVGNTVVAYFGHPVAHENDVEQAVHAGLALCAAVEALKTAAMVSLRCRIGVATAPAIVDHADDSVVGDAPGLATRLQMSAQPATVIVDETTRQLVGNLFECREVAIESGADTPLPAWRVLRAHSARSRFESLHGSSLTPFVGRGPELATLASAWREAANRLFVVDIVGEPGIGKSRLLHEYRNGLAEDGVLVLSGNCWPDSQQMSFRPFIEVVRRVFRLQADETAETLQESSKRASRLSASRRQRISGS